MSNVFIVTPAMSGMTGMSGIVSDVTFSWDNFTNLLARFDATNLNNMLTSAAVSFNGENWLSTDTAFTTAFPFSMWCWVKTDRNLSQAIMWTGDKDSSNRWSVLYITGTDVRAYSLDTSGAKFSKAAGIDPDDGDWHFIAATFDSNTYRLSFADNTVGVANTESSPISVTYDRVRISGYGDSTPGGQIIGEVDNAFFSNASLNAAQALYLYANRPTYTQLIIDFAAGVANVPNPATVLVAHKLDEPGGVRVDQTNTGLHLTPGGIASVASFTAASAHKLQAETAAVSGHPVSILSWVKSVDVDGAIAGVYRSGTSSGVGVLIDSNKARALNDDASGVRWVDSVGNVNDNAWHLLGGVFTNTECHMYVDSAAVATNTDNLTLSSTLNATTLGILPRATPQFQYEGHLAMTMIYASEITADQFAYVYNGGAGRSIFELTYDGHVNNPGMPQNMYSYDGETTGSVATDRSGSLDLADFNSVVRGVGGVVVNPPMPTAGTIDEIAKIEDRATRFDGADQSADADTAALTAYGTTIAAWVKSEETTEQTALWIGDKDADDVFVRIGIDGSGNAFLGRQASAGSEDVTQGANIDDNDWHLIVAALTAAGDVDLYVDGAAAVNDTTSVAFANFDRTSIGRHGGTTPGAFFNGTVDEVAVFDAVLTSGQRDTIYNNGVGMLNDDADLPTASAYWNMSKNNVLGAGEDQVGTLHLTLANAPIDALGIPAGAATVGRVRQLTDLTGNANHATQAVLAERPEAIAVADGTGVALYFDGTTGLDMTLSESAGNWSVIAALIVPGDTEADVFKAGDLELYMEGATYSYSDGTNRGTRITDDDLVITSWILEAASAGNVYIDGVAHDSGETYGQVALGSGHLWSTATPAGSLRQMTLNAGAFNNADHNSIGDRYATDQGLTWTEIA